MTIPQTFVKNFSVQIALAEVEIWRPGNIPTPANVDMVCGTIQTLLGATELDLPPTNVGGTWSGVSVEFFLRPTTGSALRFPLYTWDIAANKKGSNVDLGYVASRANSRPIILSKEASLMAKIKAGSLAASSPIYVWGVAIELNQY